MTGLRWSYYEAHEAMTRGPGVNERAQMSLSGLLLASEDVPLRDLAADVRRRLRDFDTAHSGALIQTLRAYLDANGSVAKVAEQRGTDPGQVYASLQKAGRLPEIERSITEEKVFEWLTSRNDVTTGTDL